MLKTYHLSAKEAFSLPLFNRWESVNLSLVMVIDQTKMEILSSKTAKSSTLLATILLQSQLSCLEESTTIRHRTISRTSLFLTGKQLLRDSLETLTLLVMTLLMSPSPQTYSLTHLFSQFQENLISLVFNPSTTEPLLKLTSQLMSRRLCSLSQPNSLTPLESQVELFGILASPTLQVLRLDHQSTFLTTTLIAANLIRQFAQLESQTHHIRINAKTGITRDSS